MNELTLDLNRIPASIVISALTTQEISSDINELTQERSRIHVSIVESAFINLPATRTETRNRQIFHKTSPGASN